MIFVFIIIGLAYIISLGILIFGFWKLPNFTEKTTTQETPFSIIIPFRNEAEILPTLLESIQKLKYPSHLFEVILVDDASEDSSVEIINEILQPNSEQNNIRLITNKRQSASPKKDAITVAIGVAKNEWILTTDADCILPATWLNAYDAFIQKYNPTLVAGPVHYQPNNTLVGQFQKFDVLSLQLVTMGFFGWGAPTLCNGANLAYRKDAFVEVDGFAGNNHVASGDDIFILEKMQKLAQGKVLFLKSVEALVTTQVQKTWADTISQRIRWASKTSKQKMLLSKLLGFLVFLTNFIAVGGLIYCIFHPDFLQYYLGFLAAKILTDFIAIAFSNTFFRSKINIGAFLISVLYYPVITMIVVLGSLKGSYSWKGRKFKKQP